MKACIIILVLQFLVICSCLPADNGYRNTLDTVDVEVKGDSNNVDHIRLARQYGGFGGYGGPVGYGGYGGYGGFPGFGGYHGFPLGYRGSFSTAHSSAHSSSYGGGFGK